MKNIDKLRKWLHDNNYVSEPIKGCGLANKHPEIYKSILEATTDLNESYVVNQRLRARIILIAKHFGDASKIISKKLTFDPKADDFINKSKNSAQAGWDKFKVKYGDINEDERYTLTETINRLKDVYSDYMGSGGHRRLASTDRKLYNSVYIHTDFLNHLGKNQNKFSHRIIALVKHNGDPKNIKCSNCCKRYPTFNYDNIDFNDLCLTCFNKSKEKYPQIGWFKRKYGDEWEKMYKLDRKKISDMRMGSLDWYVKKYGEVDGLNRYNKVTEKRINNIKRLELTKYSKISQELFWSVYEKLPKNLKDCCYFKELNKELSLTDDSGKFTFFPDFTCGNTIVEYDGVYWHKDKKNIDTLRNMIYERLGYHVICVNEDNYSRYNKSSEIVDELVLKIKNGNKTKS